MMQLYPILLVAVVLAADGGLAGAAPERGWVSVALACGPVVAILAIAAIVLAICRAGVDRGRVRALSAAERIAAGGRWALLVAFALAVLFGGWLALIRSSLGDLILVDELVALVPPLAGVLGLWWLQYPIERRVRDATIVRFLDMGRPLYPLAPRGAWVIQQARLHLLLLLVPVLLVLGAGEAIRVVMNAVDPHGLPLAREGLSLVAGFGIFLFAPLVARVVLSVERLGDGPVRDDLEAICRRHGVRVRDILLWRTGGAMINAAVMGLVGPLRYVLLTDALVEMMSRDQIRAVIAHEVGHVRRHHLSWLVLALIALLLLATLLVSAPFIVFGLLEAPADSSRATWNEGLLTLCAGAAALVGFGWISRRFERQADAFAVQHLSEAGSDERADAEVYPWAYPGEPGADARANPAAGQGADPGAGAEPCPPAADVTSSAVEAPQGDPTVTARAVAAMHGALEAIARLNAVDPQRRSWRHGSIAWRQHYLRSLVGSRCDGLAIDRFVGRAKMAVAAALIVGVAGAAFVEWRAAPRTDTVPLRLPARTHTAAEDP